MTEAYFRLCSTTPQNLFPARAEVIADEEKRAHPQQRARVRENREPVVFQLGRARHNRGEMPDAGDKIADHQRPMADPVKPVVHPPDLLVANMQQRPARECRNFHPSVRPMI